MKFLTVTGRTPIARVGFIFLAIGVARMSWWGFAHWITPLDAARYFMRSLLDSGDAPDAFYWPARAALLGLFLRFLASRILGWIRTGQ